MSNLDTTPPLTTCGGRAGVPAGPVVEIFEGKTVTLGEASGVRRLLPNLGRRLVGPWCFVDHYGPDDIAAEPGMRVPPHPHIGLQTVSWLLEGEIHHQDSLGSDQVLRPGTLGLMTSGRGITHAENSPPVHPTELHGVQLWVALPDAARHTAPTWEYHAALPVHRDRAGSITVIMGGLGGAESPGTAHSPMVGADITLSGRDDVHMPLDTEFEHAVLVMSGSVMVDETPLAPGAMLYLGCARSSITITGAAGARVLLLGGEPFDEEIVMWWNFVGRTNDEIVAARAAYLARDAAFPDIDGFDGYRMPPPELPAGRLKPGGAVRHP
ncbi:MAG: pirin family protein [Jatrophihabitans sp.]|uniref:pirin family protein n=1 Tax=Jatrophihabitans sp. TaxID=1932789 RepID=UPI003F7F9298